jgi:hypothetical protein
VKLPKLNVSHIGAYAGIVSAAIAFWIWRRDQAVAAAAASQDSGDSGMQYFLPAAATTSGYQGGGGSDLSGLLSSSLSELANNTGADNGAANFSIQQQSDLASQTLGASLLAGFLPSGSSGKTAFSITTGDGNTLSAQANVLDVGQSNDILSNAGVAALLNRAVPSANVQPQKSVAPVNTAPVKISAPKTVVVQEAAPVTTSPKSSTSLSSSDQAKPNFDLQLYNKQLQSKRAIWGGSLYPAYPGLS